jgi:hypothetical protein
VALPAALRSEAIAITLASFALPKQVDEIGKK